MTGLNLESFLQFLRADLGAWALAGLVVCVLLVLVWTSWGSRRALRKCLALSVTAHMGLALYGSTFLIVLLALQPRSVDDESPRARIRQIRVSPWPAVEPEARAETPAGRPASERTPTRLMPWDRPREALVLADARVDPPRPAVARPEALAPLATPVAAPLAATAVAPESRTPAPAAPESRPENPETASAAPPSPPPQAAPADPSDIAAPVVAPSEPARVDDPPPAGSEPRVRPARDGSPTPAGRPAVVLPDAEIRLRPHADTGADAVPGLGIPRRTTEPTGAIALAPVVPGALAPRLPEVQGAAGGRPWSEVPAVYRSRLDPNRSERAQRSGASAASEQAVERALDWLARHQDSDGRWDGATARYDDGSPVRGDDDYTTHCPPGEPCFGECIYWEADTALTGLALLAFLGSGYTHLDGKYSETVAKGIGFLLLQQKPDGDLRGRSRAVGMYCHTMAALALCEAYALTGDAQLRDPVTRAVTYLIGARAKDGMAWRYDRGFSTGDTSILGWVVMALKSAKVVGIPGPDTVRAGTVAWLEKVSGGPEHGLGRYQPQDPVTPTMTAEAWVCRQFLGVGGPGPASTEAADYLLAHGPARDSYNLYYWYYGTLAMYQHGGDAWTHWNAEVRDQVVQRQRSSGHIAGSWDPDDSLYGAKGGRIYCTALATLTLEVYYRFLRLYDDPNLPASPIASPPRNDDPTAALRPRSERTP
jgi:hypothetical protein